MEKEINYEAALSEIEEIVNKMENDEFDIDQLSVNLKRAQTLIKLCRDKLTKTTRKSRSFSAKKRSEQREMNGPKIEGKKEN